MKINSSRDNQTHCAVSNAYKSSSSHSPDCQPSASTASFSPYYSILPAFSNALNHQNTETLPRCHYIAFFLHHHICIPSRDSHRSKRATHSRRDSRTTRHHLGRNPAMHRRSHYPAHDRLYDGHPSLILLQAPASDHLRRGIFPLSLASRSLHAGVDLLPHGCRLDHHRVFQRRVSVFDGNSLQWDIGRRR